MKTELARIGNSKVIRIPAHILKECNIKDRINIEIENGKIVITPISDARAGWDKAFKEMHTNGDDQLLTDDMLDLSKADWEW